MLFDGYVKGLIFYELLDESAYGTADCESYFGLVNCDKNGNIGSVKPAYTKIQNLLDANKDVTTTSTISTTSSNVTTISTTSTGSNITTVVHVTDSALTDSSSTNVASVDTVAPLDYEQIDYPNDHILVKSYLKQIYGLNKGLLLTNSDFEFAYTWHITGVNLTEDDADMNLEVHCTSEYSKRFTELTNSADGMFLSFGQEAAFPGTVELTVPVNFAEGDAVQIYGYDATADCLYLLASDIYVT